MAQTTVQKTTTDDKAFSLDDFQVKASTGADRHPQSSPVTGIFQVNYHVRGR